MPNPGPALDVCWRRCGHPRATIAPLPTSPYHVPISRPHITSPHHVPLSSPLLLSPHHVHLSRRLSKAIVEAPAAAQSGPQRDCAAACPAGLTGWTVGFSPDGPVGPDQCTAGAGPLRVTRPARARGARTSPGPAGAAAEARRIPPVRVLPSHVRVTSESRRREFRNGAETSTAGARVLPSPAGDRQMPTRIGSSRDASRRA